MHKPFFITIPHSGEKVPVEASWLNGLAETKLMCDVDRYVDQLYMGAIEALAIPAVLCQWHRYAVDLNRLAEDVDANSVVGSANKAGSFDMGLHWVKTTTGQILMHSPVSQDIHKKIVSNYFDPFHEQIRRTYENFRQKGEKLIYHVDAHSMPSMGTTAHRDPGEKRADIVVSDFDGTSCETRFKDLVIGAYQKAGFKVAYNWPYKGGRLTQVYGRPAQGQHVVQVELNRALYMDEISKQKIPDLFANTKSRLENAVRFIVDEL